MSYKHNIIKERFDLKVMQANQVYKGEFEVDKNANYVIGIAITSDKEDLLYYRGTQKIQLNDKELFPEEFESKLLMSGLNVSPNERMIDTGLIEVGNNKMDVWYRDMDHSNTVFSPYRISIYVYSKVDV